MALTTFSVGDVFAKIAEVQNIDVDVENIDDNCYGFVVTSDTSYVDVLAQHRDAFNFQIIDGNAIRLLRRAVNDDLLIDYELAQEDCKVNGTSAAVAYQRIDIASLPRQVELQYIDPLRLYATNTQAARHLGAPLSNVTTSTQLMFVLDAGQTRILAFELLYRQWSRQTSLLFEHEDITVEPGDTIALSGDQGEFIILVQETTFATSRTNIISGAVLLTSAGGIGATSGVSLPGGTASPSTDIDEFAAWLMAA